MINESTLWFVLAVIVRISENGGALSAQILYWADNGEALQPFMSHWKFEVCQCFYGFSWITRITELHCFNITSFNRIHFKTYNEANMIQLIQCRKTPLVALSARKCNKSNNEENLVGCKPSRLWFSQHGITFTSKRVWMHRIFYSENDLIKICTVIYCFFLVVFMNWKIS